MRKQQYRDPEAPEVLDAIHDRMRKMTREEWIAELAYKPEGVPETFRTARAQKVEQIKAGTKEPFAPVR